MKKRIKYIFLLLLFIVVLVIESGFFIPIWIITGKAYCFTSYLDEHYVKLTYK